MKCLTNIPLPYVFYFISSNADATQALSIITKWYDPLHIIMWPYWFIDLDLTCSSPLLRSIGAKSSLKPPATRSNASKPLTCPSHLQPVHQAKPHLDLLHLVTWLHVMSHMQWAPLSHNYLWTNHLCISLKHILVQLGCHSITKTKQGPFTSTPLNFPSLSISLFSKYHKSSSY